MIIENLEMIRAFSKHFNTRITTSDYVNNSAQMVDLLNKKSQDLKNLIVLPCEEEVIYQQLVKFRYPELLYLLSQNIFVHPEFYDIYLSDLDKNLFECFLWYLDFSKKHLKVDGRPSFNTFEITGPNLFLDITIGAFSQFHTEITSQLNYFNGLIALNSKTSDCVTNTDNLFINSKVSTAYSYFVIAYLGENLNIKLQL